MSAYDISGPNFLINFVAKPYADYVKERDKRNKGKGKKDSVTHCSSIKADCR